MAKHIMIISLLYKYLKLLKNKECKYYIITTKLNLNRVLLIYIITLNKI